MEVKNTILAIPILLNNKKGESSSLKASLAKEHFIFLQGRMPIVHSYTNVKDL